MSRYSAKGLPWSSGIGHNVEECTTAREVMESAGLNWNVKKCELVAQMPFSLGGDNTITEIDEINGTFARDGYIYRGCPNAYATYRTDKNIPLGLVKEKYNVVQNMDAFTFFDEAIGPDKAIFKTAGMFGYGQKVYVSCKLPVSTNVSGDPIDHYLVFSNSHDGSSSVTVMFTPVRVFCSNCLNGALKNSDSFIRIRHTDSVRQKLDEGARILKLACEFAQDSTQLYNALASKTMRDSDVLAYICGLILDDVEYHKVITYDKVDGFKKLLNKEFLILESTGISTRKANMIESIYTYYHTGVAQDKIIGTAWGAYNSITGYYSNVDNKDGEKRMNSLLYGNAQLVMQRAFVDAYDYAQAV